MDEMSVNQKWTMNIVHCIVTYLYGWLIDSKHEKSHEERLAYHRRLQFDHRQLIDSEHEKYKEG